MFLPHKDRSKIIFAIALPIMGGMASQTILNLVDTLMVSSLGATSIAAVGFGSMTNFLSIAFVMGMSSGVQALASRRKGEGQESFMALPLNGGLVLVALFAIPMSAILYFLAPTIFGALTTDPEVAAIGIPYWQIRLLGMIAIGANYAFRGYWNGVSRSKLYLRTLLVMHVSNLVLSYLFIFGAGPIPTMGALGAGLGTTIATFIGTGYYFWLGQKHASAAGFLRHMPKRSELKTILTISLPSGIQSLLFAAGLTALYVILDRVGTSAVAAGNVVINVTMVAFLPGLGLGLAAASLVGQALGRKDIDDAAAWGWDVTRIAIVFIGGLGLPMALFPELILGAFLSQEPESLAIAISPLRLSGLTMAVEAVAMVLMNSIVGAGATRTAMIVSASMQWLVFLPLAYFVGPYLGFGFFAIWASRIAYRAIEACIYAVIWRKRKWAQITL